MNHQTEEKLKPANGKLPVFSIQLFVFNFLLCLPSLAGTETLASAKPEIGKLKADTNAPKPDASLVVGQPVAAPKSVFTDDAQFGRDPFFPGSARRAPKIVARASAVDPRTLPLTLKVIIVGQNKKLAHINNRSFEPGEQSEVLAGGQKIRIKCLEIREQSVLISFEGTQKELFLRTP